ncbi:MAG TPA: FixH family protein [Armatimonadota bacterium]|jgi:secreted PhoX family phosphatase
MKTLVTAILLSVSVLLAVVASAAGQSAQAGKFTVELTSQPAAIVVGDNTLTFTVTDGGKPVRGAGVDVHLDMTAMSMPSDVKATPGAQPGEYTAKVNFGMAGAWTVSAKVQHMAGMDMTGDGIAAFTVQAGKAALTGETAPTTPAPTSQPWPAIIIGALVAIGVVVGIVARKKKA